MVDLNLHKLFLIQCKFQTKDLQVTHFSLLYLIHKQPPPAVTWITFCDFKIKKTLVVVHFLPNQS